MMNLPRVVIAAVSSGSGKTTIVTGLIKALREKGLRVAPYKIGPDYIDPGYHALAAGRPAHNLDTWLVGKDNLQKIFTETAKDADIAIIEGVMGLYDGGRGGISSTAEIAKLLCAPVILVIDAKSMGASAAAIALGFKNYDKNVNFAGVILNRLGSATHEELIRQALNEIGVKVFGAIKRDAGLIMPERHLGLLPTEENTALEVVDKIGAAIDSQVDLDSIINLANNASQLAEEKAEIVNKEQTKVKIAIAKDEAFSFYYPESIAVLEKMGARIIYFSPLKDEKLPKADGLILGGGFPEMFAEKLSANESMLSDIREKAENNLPIYAECGGYMYLMESLTDFAGRNYKMAGIIPNRAVMKEKLQMVGYVTAKFNFATVLGEKDDEVHGHEFHFSTEELEPKDAPFIFMRLRNGQEYPAGYAAKNILGSYLHLHFVGNEGLAKNFIDKCKAYRRSLEA